MTFCTSLLAKTYESNSFADLLKEATSETLVLCDVDNTLIESTLHLGSAQWRKHLRNKMEGFDNTEVLVEKFWRFVQPLIPVKPVDAQTIDVIETLKASNITVLGLTGRDPVEAEHTEDQLEEQGIVLSNFHEGIELHTSNPALYQNSVIYAGDNTKAEALFAFFKQTGYMPKKILFIDDRKDQIHDLEKCVEARGIAFVGIRFSGADARVKEFDPHVADLQWACLPHILSDTEAKELLYSKS